MLALLLAGCGGGGGGSTTTTTSTPPGAASPAPVAQIAPTGVSGSGAQIVPVSTGTTIRGAFDANLAMGYKLSTGGFTILLCGDANCSVFTTAYTSPPSFANTYLSQYVDTPNTSNTYVFTRDATGHFEVLSGSYQSIGSTHTNPIFSPALPAGTIYDASMTWDGMTYILALGIGSSATNEIVHIYKGTSPAGPFSGAGLTSTNLPSGVYAPWIMFNSGKYYMFFSDDITGIARTQIASSTDLNTWTTSSKSVMPSSSVLGVSNVTAVEVSGYTYLSYVYTDASGSVLSTAAYNGTLHQYLSQFTFP